MALAFSQFGSTDAVLYAAYLATYYNVEGGDFLASSGGVHGGIVEPGGGTGDAAWGSFVGTSSYFATLVASRQSSFGGTGGRGGFSGPCSGCARGRGYDARPCDAGENHRISSGEGGECAPSGGVFVDGGQCGDVVGDIGSVDRDDIVSGRGKHYGRNKARRERAKLARRGVSGVAADVGGIPEWRRKGGTGVGFHKGVFHECSESVRDELRDSRARMLVAQNEAAVVKAEHEKRTVSARIQSRLIEEEVERKRLESAVSYEKLAASFWAGKPSGYAETMVSAGVDVPSLTSGSVSPDSSVSVAELKKRDEACAKLLERIEDLEAELRRCKSPVSGPTVAKKEPVAVRFEGETVGGVDFFSSRRPASGPGSGRDGYGKWDY